MPSPVLKYKLSKYLKFKIRNSRSDIGLLKPAWASFNNGRASPLHKLPWPVLAAAWPGLQNWPRPVFVEFCTFCPKLFPFDCIWFSDSLDKFWLSAILIVYLFQIVYVSIFFIYLIKIKQVWHKTKLKTYDLKERGSNSKLVSVYRWDSAREHLASDN